MTSFRYGRLFLLFNALWAMSALPPPVSAASQAPSPHKDSLVSRRHLSKRFVNEQGHYNISFYHINDVHAHLDEFSASGTDCPRKESGCRGGYARVRAAVQESRPCHPDSLFLNAGDEFQGTMFFSYYGGEKIAATLNQMGIDGMTLGNHEWDRGDDYLGEFLENLTFPIISSNVRSSNERLNRTIKSFHIYEQYQLAVIGVTTETTPSISKPGNDTTFADPVKSVQATIDLIRTTTNITRIAALTHIGYAEDQRLARETTGLYLIMGGHSHTKLGTDAGSAGPYPTIVENKEGHEVFVVTAWRWGEQLGYIDVVYDDNGKILAYHGAPIRLTNATKQDPQLQQQINEWRVPFEEYAAEEIGRSSVFLDQTTCQAQECLLGDLIADAMLDYRLNLTGSGPEAPAFAVTNAGGIRASIDQGPITRGEVITAFPFSNAVVEVSMTGDRLWNTLSGIFNGVNHDNGLPVTSFLQVSRGIVLEYDKAGANGVTLTSVTIDGKPLDKGLEYKIVTVDFLATGGDNFFSPKFTDLVALDKLDDVLAAYISATSPIDIKLEGRIRALDG